MREQLTMQQSQARRAHYSEMRQGGVPLDTADSGAFQAAPPRRRASRPWVLRLLAVFVFLCAALARLAARLARKNAPLAIGIGLFVLLLLLAGYNAFFRQSRVARPVLFSTRENLPAVPEGAGRPFVLPAISTQALRRAPARSASAAKPLNRAAESPPRGREDQIAALIAAAGKAEIKAKPAAAPAKPQPFAARKAEAESKAAMPRPRPESRSAESKTAGAADRRAHILRVQRALRRGGAPGLRPTGEWDAAGRAALRRFQGRHGLVMTGQADKQTIAKMRRLNLW